MNFLSVQPTLIIRGIPASEMRLEDFMNLDYDKLLNEDFNERSHSNRKYADVGIVDGELDSRKTRFYMKRTYHEPIKNSLRQMLALRALHYNTMREALAVEELSKRGFLVNEVAAFGEHKVMGFPRSSFVLAPEVSGSLLYDFFDEMNRNDRAVAIREYGDLLARLHDRGFYQRLKLADLIYRKSTEDSCELILIDRDVISPWPTKRPSKETAICNTATNLRLLFKRRLSPREGLAFLRSYKQRSKLFADNSKREWYSAIKSACRDELRRRPIWKKHGEKWRV